MIQASPPQLGCACVCDPAAPGGVEVGQRARVGMVAAATVSDGGVEFAAAHPGRPRILLSWATSGLLAVWCPIPPYPSRRITSRTSCPVCRSASRMFTDAPCAAGSGGNCLISASARPSRRAARWERSRYSALAREE